MAVFLVNVCKFNGCGITFPTLDLLIYHIESVHLDFDSGELDQENFQRPQCLPISYILRAFNGNNVREPPKDLMISPPTQIRPLKRPYSPALSLSSATPTGSEMDEDNESESEASRDSWSQAVDGNATNVMKMMKPKTAATTPDEEKPFVCSYESCKKRYRNTNGLKYHIKNAHTNKVDKKPTITPTIAKEFKCHCGKIYKTAHGLRQHNLTHQQQEAKAAIVALTPEPNISSTATTNAASSTTPLVQSLKGKDGVLASFVRMKAQAAAQSNKAANNSNGTPLTDGSILKSAITGNTSNYIVKNMANVSEKEATVKSCPNVTAPTLQQHLLSPVVNSLRDK
ncbi:Juxtaposed with another zinc finger protein 1 [Halotydeus destructor]|nr:Juxtaposed with another zinc finger protein 1 [Halotydeus destructor]